MTDQVRNPVSALGRDPAFPCPGFEAPGGSVYWPEPGLSKREEFAARALVALIPMSRTKPMGHAWAAGQAVLYADALLAELNRTG